MITSNFSCRPSTRSYPCLGVVIAVLITFAAGCAHDRPVHIQLDPEVRRPAVAAVVFFVDGFGRDVFDQALADGRIPNIERHIVRRGVVADQCVSSIPSITYAVSVSFLTGQYPGHHGILSNKWFEPSSGRYQNYCSTATYQLVDSDYEGSPTIYERMPNRTTVSIQAAMRRGCTRSWDNWASSGLNWFFNNHAGVDCLVAQRFEEIGTRSPQWGQWPDLIWAYFPALDYIGHEYGPGSARHQETLANVDRQIGHICEALAEIGMYERTYFCLVSDHGMTRVEPDRVFDVSAHLQEATGSRVWFDTPTTPATQNRILSGYDFAVATTASRWSAIYPIPASHHAARQHVDALIGDLNAFVDTDSTGASVSPADLLPAWLAGIAGHPAVEMMACRIGDERVFLFTSHGCGLVTRSAAPPHRHSLRQWPVGALVDEETVTSVGKVSAESDDDSRLWLALTASSRYPDLIPQISALFKHERAGTIVLFAADGWDFSRDDPVGGHGSILASDMLVPMAFAGPGIGPETRVPLARVCDLAPTLLHLLGADVHEDSNEANSSSSSLPRMDGVNLLPDVHAP